MAMGAQVSKQLKMNQPLFADNAAIGLTTSLQTDNPFTPGHWSQNIVIRLAIGVGVTVGITILLMRLIDLAMFWTGSDEKFWNTLAGFITWQTIQVIAVFFGSMLAVAGRNEMVLLGLLIGMVVGFTTLILFPTNPHVSSTLYFAMPAWFAVSSTLGAIIGESLWHPLQRKQARTTSISKLTQEHADMSIMQTVRMAIVNMILANIRWIKVILASACIVATLWFAQPAVNWIISKFGLQDWVQEVGLQKSWVVTMLKITVVILGATFAGSSTMHGIAHGFWVGLMSGVANLLLHVFIPKTEVLPTDLILWEIGWVFAVSIAAGGFGAHVIPPMIVLAQRRRPASLR